MVVIKKVIVHASWHLAEASKHKFEDLFTQLFHYLITEIDIKNLNFQTQSMDNIFILLKTSYNLQHLIDLS